MAKQKITREELKACVEKGMTDQEIALKYQMNRISIRNRIEQMKDEELTPPGYFIQKEEPDVKFTIPGPFDLKIGDKVTARDEVLGKEVTYKVVSISKHVFVAESTHFKTSFRIMDYRHGRGVRKKN